MHQNENDNDDDVEDDQTKDDPELLEIESNAAKQSEDRELTQEEMDSQLNPDAKEFVPTSPQRTTPTSSPFNNGNGTNGNQLLRQHLLIDDDCVLAQSPRKGAAKTMDNITLPSEVDFDDEITKRPQEFEEDIVLRPDILNNSASIPATELINGDRPGSSSSQYSYQEMNLKEAMHGDEKQEYAPEDTAETPEVAAVNSLSVDNHTLSETPIENNGLDDSVNKYLSEEDPMNMSFYNDGSADSKNPFAVDLNAVQVLPVGDEEDEEGEEKEIEDFNVLVEDPYYLNGNEGQQFVIQDTAFGMNENVSNSVTPDESIQQNTAAANIEQDSNAVPSVETNQSESDLIEAETVFNMPTNDERKSSIVQAVQEMAFEVTSLLNDVNSISDRVTSDLATTNDTVNTFEETPTALVSPQIDAEDLVKNNEIDSDNKYDGIDDFETNNELSSQHTNSSLLGMTESEEKPDSYTDYSRPMVCDLTKLPGFDSNVYNTEQNQFYVEEVSAEVEASDVEPTEVVEPAEETPVEIAKPVDTLVEVPVEILLDTPVEASVDTAVEASADTPVDTLIDTPAEAPVDTPIAFDTIAAASAVGITAALAGVALIPSSETVEIPKPTDAAEISADPIEVPAATKEQPSNAAATKKLTPASATTKATKKPEVKPKVAPIIKKTSTTTNTTATAAPRTKPASAVTTKTSAAPAARPRSVPTASTTAKAPIERKPITLKKPLTNGESTVKSSSSLLSSSNVAKKPTTITKTASSTSAAPKLSAITKTTAAAPRTLAPKPSAPKSTTSTTTTTSKPATTTRYV